MLNNAKQVLDSLKQSNDDNDKHLILTENSEFNGVRITDENIKNNSKFILNMWNKEE